MSVDTFLLAHVWALVLLAVIVSALVWRETRLARRRELDRLDSELVELHELRERNARRRRELAELVESIESRRTGP